MARRKRITLLPGDQRWRLTLIREAGKDKNGKRRCVFRCVCGNDVVALAAAVKDGNTKSCGCLQHEPHIYIHGYGRRDSRGPEYRAWCALIGRCTNPKNKSYRNYGGRGITVSPEWLASFETFLADMGPRPSGMSIDRLDNNKGYCKENCAWRGVLEQANNRRTTRRIAFNGETHTILEWSEKTGVRTDLIRARLRHGWPLARVFEPPVRSPHLFRPTIGIAVTGTT